jgi:hypothetical protein
MNSEVGGLVALIDVKRAMREPWRDEDPQEKGPSRIRRAAAALRQLVASVAQNARATPERRYAGRDAVSTGD